MRLKISNSNSTILPYKNLNCERNKMNKLMFQYLTILSVLLISIQTDAQPQQVVAEYPLLTSLEDSTGINNDIFLEGNPELPALPSKEVSLCSNGIYLVDENGQDIITPIMPFLDINNFTIEVEFNINQLPSPTAPRPRMPIIMGSKFARWLGIYINSEGVMGYKFNNDVNNYRWSNTVITNQDDWYSSKISYVNGRVELYLDDQLILTDDIPPLNTFQNTFNFTITDFSEGNSFNGCIRNLVISTDVVIFKNSFD